MTLSQEKQAKKHKKRKRKSKTSHPLSFKKVQ
jgi:hypothetical protein